MWTLVVGELKGSDIIVGFKIWPEAAIPYRSQGKG